MQSFFQCSCFVTFDLSEEPFLTSQAEVHGDRAKHGWVLRFPIRSALTAGGLGGGEAEVHGGRASMVGFCRSPSSPLLWLAGGANSACL